MAPFVPHTLFDEIIKCYKLKNDAALARMLKISPANISRFRYNRRPIGASLILAVHDATNWPIKRIKELLDD
jgi:DNA-binding transcriptional regulator YdaS (Cro superfamily)